MRQFICDVASIPDNSGREFELGGVAFVVVRMGKAVFAYQNHCPHQGTPLNWMPDQFMDYDKQYIQCATHGALFRPDTGLCITGPCHGAYLEPVAVRVRDGKLFLA